MRSQTKTVWKLICLYCRTQERLTGREKWKANYTPVSSSATNPPPPGAQRAATATRGGTDTSLITAAISAGTIKQLLTLVLLSLLMLLQPVNWAEKQMGGK